MRRIIRSLAVLTLVGALAACSQGSDSGGSAGLDADSAPQDGVVADEAAPESGGSTTEDRQVIVTGSLTLTVEDAIAAAGEAQQIVEDSGGRVDAYSQQDPYEDVPVSVYLTVRIPSEDLGPTLDALQALGEVEDLALDRQDVTLQMTDLDARIESLEISIERLQGLMAEATTTADLLAAEAALTQRQAELDSLVAQRTYLSEQVDLATISLALLPEEVAPAPAPEGFWGGVQKGWSALVNAFNAVVVVLGALLPWAILAGVIAGIVLLVRRLVPHKPKPPRPASTGPAPFTPLSGPQQYGPPQQQGQPYPGPQQTPQVPPTAQPQPPRPGQPPQA